jgi:hypothetical protein
VESMSMAILATPTPNQIVKHVEDQAADEHDGGSEHDTEPKATQKIRPNVHLRHLVQSEVRERNPER